MPDLSTNELRVSGLLSVPRYADALEGDDDENGSRPGKVIKSAAAWRLELSKWAREAQEEEADNMSDKPPETATPTTAPAPHAELVTERNLKYHQFGFLLTLN
ncbi:hypothetical protein B0H13DRAFT_1852518 [Mycena leptocephala]|nr:hypothetical protein B0H13DRAFT_1852518 [Mycena leptocephala]